MDNKKLLTRIVTYGLVLGVLSIVFFMTKGTSPFISLSKSEYLVGETLEINLNTDNLNGMSLDLITPTGSYKFLNPSKKIMYKLGKAGDYNVKLYNLETELASENFTVKSVEEAIELQPQLELPDYFKVERDNINLGEEIIINLNKTLLDETFTLEIKSEQQTFNYPKIVSSLRFMPKKRGNYDILLYQKERLVQSKSFYVEDGCESCQQDEKEETAEESRNETDKIGNNLLEQNISIERSPYQEEKDTFRIRDSKGDYINANITLISRPETKSFLNNLNQDNQTYLRKGRYSLIMYPKLAGIKRFNIFDLEYDGNFNLGMEELPTKAAKISDKNVMKAFSVDPSGLTFSSAFVEVEAKGNQLFKCREWNFTEQKCQGSWEFVRAISPGQTYEIQLNSTDPGFAEVGLASINTDKAIYHPNEPVNISVVALDNLGYLVAGASVDVTITNPNNISKTLTTVYEEIIETEKGIYEGVFNETSMTGRYTLFVSASWGEFNNSMLTYFDVADYYDFDILRETPVTTDPWQGPFESRIRIISYNYTGLFNFTEKLPLSFWVVNTGGGELYNDSNSTYLKWTNATNNSVFTYSVLPPLVTPELYEMGLSRIETTELIFTEARPWFLAVDPVLYTQVCEGQDNNNQNTYNDPCDGQYPNDCGAGNADRLTCNDGNYETQTGTNNNNWAGVRIYSYDPSIAYCDSITRVDLCYEWWQDANNDFDNARIAVDRNNWASPTTISTTVPGTSANPGVTCTAVTSSEAWTCSNFDGTGTAAQAVAQAQRNNDGGTRTLTIDVLFFNLTYAADYPPNVTSLNYPPNGANLSSLPITFNFTAIDDKRLQNCSLYMNISGWTVRGTSYNPANNTNTNITISPSEGLFTWNIRCWDNRTTRQDAWYSANYTVRIDLSPPNTTLNYPPNSEVISTGYYDMNATAYDNVSMVDTIIFEYRQNSTDTWKFACKNNTRMEGTRRCTWNLMGLPAATTYEVRAYANDTLGNSGIASSSTNINYYGTPPVIQTIQCEIDSAGSWQNCNNLGYGETLRQIRANCTAPGQNISNVSFRLINLFDNTTLLENATTDNSTGHWKFDNTDLFNMDSGDFNLTVTCLLSSSLSYAQNYTLWNVPFGTIAIDWYDPTTNVNVTQFEFTNFSATVTCNDGECINITAILDPEMLYPIANMSFEPITDFPLVDGICPTSDTCAVASPWDDYDNCIAGNGQYGICSSTYTDKFGTYGLMCRGCDRNNAGNTGGIYLNIPSTACSGYPCSSIFVSYYQIVQSMDSDAQGSAVFVNDSDGVLRIVSTCMRGSGTCDCDRQTGCTQATMGQYAEYINVNICSIPGIDCELPLTLRFTSYSTTSNHDTNEYFGWDEVNITGTLPKGIIPYRTGAPFYTNKSNPMSWENNSCLTYLVDGQSCTVTWDVNATGMLFSVHDFFVNGSTFEPGSETHSNSISVIIVNKTAPYVSLITLNPTVPIDSSDLNCSFTISDPNTFDSLSANISWYRNGIYYSSEIVSVSNNALETNFLDASNTNYGEEWFCSVIPYDGSYYGEKTNSSSVTVLISNPPIINNIQCQINSTIWSTCNNVRFNDRITYVRANCTDIDGSIMNVTFNLSNYEDSNTFFSETSYSPIAEYYYLNNEDLTVIDSGNFTLNVLCYDDSGVSTSSSYSWFIPFGNLIANMTKPPKNVNITQYRLSNFTVTLTCSGGECGNVTGVLDPLRPYLKTFMNFESPTNFPLDNNECGTGAGWQCSSSTPWDGFDNCLDSAGSYGICASAYANAGGTGTRGLMCAGCDRSDGANVGGLYFYINSTFCNGYVCSSVNLSYYQIVQDMESSTEGSAVLVRDTDDTSWRNVSVCLGGDPECDCDSMDGCTIANLGAYAQFTNQDLCQIPGIDCSKNLTVFFTSAYPIAHGTGDYFVWDQINVTAYGMKGTIPMNAGSPFYTLQQNPVTAADNNCLFNMTSGQSCTLYWLVNATGLLNSTHEIFAYFNSTYTSINVSETTHINATITGNYAPNATVVTIGPSNPLNDSNLNCTFTITDPNYFDNLFANISWYRNGILRHTQNVSVAIETSTTLYLTANNTEPGDIWKCGVTPFDQYLWGTQKNSSNVTIYLYPPPSVNNIQCMVNGAWTSCTNALYYRNLSAVRANCSSQSRMVNATFNLTNVPDNTVFFNNVTTDNSTVYFVFNNTDINISDSGEWILGVKCMDNNSQEAKSFVNWTVPWGTLSSVLVSPDSNTAVSRNEFFTFQSRVTCNGGECGNVSATLDPYNTTAVYDFKSGYGTNKWAYAVESNSIPPESVPNSRTALTTAQVNSINVSENTRYTMPDPGAGDYESIEMIFLLNQTAANVRRIELIYEGRASTSSNAVIYAWNYGTNAWTQITSLAMDTVNDATAIGNITTGITNYVNSTKHMRWLVIDSLTSEYLHVDYVAVNITYDIYKGILSTVPGELPFYTTDNNPKDYRNQSCLANMSAGKTCITTWNVNATGPHGSVHEFFVYYNATNYTSYLGGSSTSHIFITIADATLVPPTVTLLYPPTATYTNITTHTFNCSATDNTGLQNISLYSNFNGSFVLNESIDVAGVSAAANFTKTLQDGAYFWNCLGYDLDNNLDWGAANWTLTVDTVSPTIYISYPPNDTVLSSSTVVFNFTAYDALDTIMVCNLTLDGVNEATFTNFNVNNFTWTTKTRTGLSVTDHFWNVSCIDNAGNRNITETYKFSVGDLPPTVSLLSSIPYYTSPDITLYYTATDNSMINVSKLILNGNVDQTQYFIENGGISEFTLVGLPEGRYNWTVNVSDASNLTAQAPLRFFTIDYTFPSLTLNFPPDNHSTNTTLVSINFTAIDNLDLSMMCNLTVNNVVVNRSIAGANNSATVFAANAFTDGINYWNLTCADDAGNYNISETRMINVSAPPVIMLNYPPNNYTQASNNVIFYYTPTDNVNLSRCDLIINNEFNQTNSSGLRNGQMNNFTLSNMGQGDYYWRINCTDVSGFSGMSEEWKVTIDSTSPYMILHHPTPGGTVSGGAGVFNFSAVDNLDNALYCNITIDGLIKDSNFYAFNNTPTNRTINVTGEGTHYWNVTCIDNAGNYNTSETRNFTLEANPIVSLMFPLDNALLNSNLVNFTYIPQDSNLRNATLILNGIWNETNTSLINEELNYFRLALPDGTYNWTVNVTDTTNLSTTPPVRRFRIDTTPPSLTLKHPYSTELISWNDVKLNYSVTDNIDNSMVCNISVNGILEYSSVPSQNNTDIIRYKALNDGSHTWGVICIDDANNSVNSQVSFSVEAPPSVTLLSPSNNTRTANYSMDFAYFPYDIFGIQNCSLFLNNIATINSSSITNNQSNILTVASLEEGLQNWTVMCYDNPPDLNPYSPPAWLFRVDRAGPTITLNHPDPDETINTNDVNFNYSATDSDNVIIDCNISVSDPLGNRLNFTSRPAGVEHIITLRNFSDGEHYWNVTCIDDLGNLNTSETRRFVINKPDLYTSSTRVWFNNSNPDHYENITISINVSNLGGQPVNNLLVNFYDGDPGNGGIFIGNASNNVGIGQNVTFRNSWLISPGYHTIYISVDPYNEVSEMDETNNNATKTISVLWINATYPYNATWWNTLTVPFNFTAGDYTGGSINYSVRIDNNPNGQNGSVADNVENSININFTQGTHATVIRVNDTLGRIKDSLPITLYIDTTRPSIVFSTVNLSWFNYTNPAINFTISDNMDQMLNYTIYVDGLADIVSNSSTGILRSISLSALPNGTHTLYIEAFDEAGNWINSSTLTIYVDTVEPTIRLNYPGNGDNFFTNSVIFNFSVFDNIDPLLTCNLTIDGAVNVSNINVYNNSFNLTNVTNLGEMVHYWNVTCWDGNSVTAVNMKNVSETRAFSVFDYPLITLNTPLNNNWTNIENVSFFFNVSDTTGIENCTLLINGQPNITKTSSQLVNNGQNNFTVNKMNGTYEWAVECYDSTVFRNYGVSSNRTLYVDLDAPESFFETANNTWFNTQTPLINFNVSDNMDALLNYTILVNETKNKNGTVNNATPSSTSLNAISDGYYLLTVEAMDNAYNIRNSSSIKIYVDTTPPSITLIKPENSNITTDTTIFFNFSATDNLAETMLCNLTVDGSIRGNFNITSGLSNSTTLTFNAGMHYWNVTCIDVVGNRNTSQTYNFSIPLPDLTLTSSDIKFNTSMPEEGKNISINATIYNIGDTDAKEVVIQFFNGHYSLNNQIGSSFLYNLSAKSNITLNISWPASGVGRFDIYVVVDPPLATNGNIIEANETNNYAYNTISIGSYEIIYGNFTGILSIQSLGNLSVYEWAVWNFTGSKIYAVDYDSIVSWANLQALGRSSAGAADFNDFRQLDIALFMENNTDSINYTWTEANTPRLTDSFTVYNRQINNVPVANSTNISVFSTGILWDTSDPASGGLFNGTQDVIFMTTVNQNATGSRGVYDFELRVPANLRRYKGPDNQKVLLYTEII